MLVLFSTPEKQAKSPIKTFIAMQHYGQIVRVSLSLQSPIIKAHSSLIIIDKIGADADGYWTKKNYESRVEILGNAAKHIKGACDIICFYYVD